MRTVRIGGGLGFYGDSLVPALEMAERGEVQYIAFDHLAELTLAILQKDRQRDPSLGYTRDLIPLMASILPVARRKGIRLVTNAGGLNPLEAAQVVARLAGQLGLSLRIGVVAGDDLLGRLDELRGAGADLAHADTGEPLETVRDRLVFANAYLGALPIARALAQGAHVVITGRVADSALFLGPILHELGWVLPAPGGAEPDASPAAWDRIAVGVVAGHLLECSGQVTGGNHSGNWAEVPDLDRIGFPVAEVGEDGTLRITKVPGTGGRVNFDTVREQLLYEVHDPSAYHTPDVTVDLTGVELDEVGPDTVRVRGVRGRRPPSAYKVVMGYRDGFLGQGVVGFSWPDALRKAEAAAEILRRQAGARRLPIEEFRVEYLGLDSLHGPLASRRHAEDLNEVYLRVAVRTRSREAAEAFARLLPPLGLSGPPTASGFIGVDRVRELLGVWPTRVPREWVDPFVEVQVMEV
ncbi:acyclic terpene utilization AtuA family protein [Caldinitratiruptor microaerophilus]|uniref:ABC transporter substrate-binding protein n=1 Tax=Caldinitratiruptor microaerophilus TaxID=671077 RepID=A0AA35CIN9_9FIRM|nr:acyclic terpene utilization AtuA family protein [Caldinitratiruptor microaerophilus]BDG59822.1 ABC transporter substrate-binding protein [Caldinitratiruptor microaerophilus]